MSGSGWPQKLDLSTTLSARLIPGACVAIMGAMDFDVLKAFAEDGPVTLVVDGDCMADSLPHGSQIRVGRKSVYWPGDIIVFARGDGRLVSHRFLGYARSRGAWFALSRADQSSRADAPLALDRVLGALEAIENEPSRTTLSVRIGSVFRYLKAVFVLLKIRLSRRAGSLSA